MENPGEHLVGQYLREIMKCDFVEYNLQINFIQGEIDVVGIDTKKRKVFICEVATHLETGLQYTKDGSVDNINRFTDKFKKNIKYANKFFKDYEHNYMLWSPVIRIPKKKNAKINQLNDIVIVQENILKKHNIKIELMFNEEYLKCIEKLRVVAGQTTQAMTSPIMRFMQIEEKIKMNNLRNGSL